MSHDPSVVLMYTVSLAAPALGIVHEAASVVPRNVPSVVIVGVALAVASQVTTLAPSDAIAAGLILALVTAAFLILAVVTAFFFSCAGPTLFRGSSAVAAAADVPPS